MRKTSPTDRIAYVKAAAALASARRVPTVDIALDFGDFGPDVARTTVFPEELATLLVTKLQRVMGEGTGTLSERLARVPDLRAKAKTAITRWLPIAQDSLNQAVSDVLFGDLFTQLISDAEILGIFERQPRDIQQRWLARPSVRAALDRLQFGVDKDSVHRVKRLYELLGRLPTGRKKVPRQLSADAELARQFAAFERGKPGTRTAKIRAFAKSLKRQPESVRVQLQRAKTGNGGFAPRL